MNINTMTKYAPLSKRELEIISRLEFENITIVPRSYLLQICRNPGTTNKVISNLLRKRRLKHLGKKKYLLIPVKAPYQQWSENSFIIADALMDSRHYYIGYNSMYNYYNFSEQVPQTIFILNLRFSGRKIVNGLPYKFIKIDPSKYYGITTLAIDNREIKISDRERTLVDLVYNYKPLSSLKSVYEVIGSQLSRINLGNFIAYAGKFPNPTTRKRIGFTLEALGVKRSRLNLLIKTIRRNRALTTLYENKTRKGKIDKTWRLIING